MNAATAAPAHSPRMFQLDAFRGIAAFIIVFYHLTIVYRLNGPFERGYLFVDLFFLLSGFVLAVSTEKKLNSGIGAFEFTRARFIRLWPLVAVGFLMTSIALIWSAYFIHEFAHLAIFKSAAANRRWGTLMTWLNGSCIAHFDDLNRAHEAVLKAQQHQLI